jgi:hypothetical protein
MSVLVRNLGHALSGLARGAGEVAVAHGLVADRQFQCSEEEQAASPAVSVVEAEHELVEVAGQGGRGDRALMGAQQPPLEQRGRAMDAGRLLGLAGVS